MASSSAFLGSNLAAKRAWADLRLAATSQRSGSEHSAAELAQRTGARYSPLEMLEMLDVEGRLVDSALARLEEHPRLLNRGGAPTPLPPFGR